MPAETRDKRETSKKAERARGVVERIEAAQQRAIAEPVVAATAPSAHCGLNAVTGFSPGQRKKTQEEYIPTRDLSHTRDLRIEGQHEDPAVMMPMVEKYPPVRRCHDGKWRWLTSSWKDSEHVSLLCNAGDCGRSQSGPGSRCWACKVASFHLHKAEPKLYPGNSVLVTDGPLRGLIGLVLAKCDVKCTVAIFNAKKKEESLKKGDFTFMRDTDEHVLDQRQVRKYVVLKPSDIVCDACRVGELRDIREHDKRGHLVLWDNDEQEFMNRADIDILDPLSEQVAPQWLGKRQHSTSGAPGVPLPLGKLAKLDREAAGQDHPSKQSL